MTDKIFDEYGNYDFPTDIKQSGLNTATSCRSVKMTKQEEIKQIVKESILFDKLGVYSFNLKTKTLRTEDKNVTTYYWVIWSCKYGESSEIKQEITKEEYEFLLKELEDDR